METRSQAAFVPDVSVAAKWYFDDEDDTGQARGILTRFQAGEAHFIVPDCFYYEFVALVRKAERRIPPRVAPPRSDETVTEVAAVPMEVIDSRLVLGRALALSRSLDITTYDAFYVLVAQENQALFVTADSKLYERIKQLPFVRWLGDLSLET